MIENAVKFHSDDNLDMFYDAENKLMIFDWKRRTVGEPYRNSFLMGLDYAKTRPTKYFISDITKQGVVGPEDRKWFEEVAIPLAIESGGVKAAIIFDGNVFKEYYINNIMMRFKRKHIPIKVFRSKDAAIHWLLEPLQV